MSNTSVGQLINNSFVNELLEKTNLDWTVSKQQLTLPNGKNSIFHSIVRDDTGTEFNSVKDGYTIFQNSELAELLIRLSEKTGYEIHNGGLFNGGAKVYMQLKSPNNINNIGINTDIVKGFFTAINSHDGSTSLMWGESNITISCSNTFARAMKQLKNKARHTQSLHKNIDLSLRDIEAIDKEQKSLFDTFIKLAEIPVTKVVTTEIVKSVTGVDTLLTQSEIEEKYSTYSINRSKELLSVIASEMTQKGQTMWGLLSGVTNYTTHVMPNTQRKFFTANNQPYLNIMGKGYEHNNKALDLIMAHSKL